MKIEVGTILSGINPFTNEKEYFKYLGKSDSYLYNSGYKRVLKQKGQQGTITVSDEWAKRWKLKKHIKGA